MQVMKEVDVMKRLDHQNVVKLHEVIDDDEEDKLYLIMDYCSNKEVLRWDVKKEIFSPYLEDQEFMPEDNIRNIMRHCISGLYYIHKSGIVHRDLKPQNILITETHDGKIADFGVSALFTTSDSFSNTEGTYHFMAPELCNPDVDSYSGTKADVWALGVVLFCLAFNSLPYNEETEFRIMQ